MRIVEIQSQVAAHYKLEMSDMKSRSRKRRVVRPRQIGMYLCRELTNKSYMEIARAFAKDHSTVMSGVAEIGIRMGWDEELADDVAAIRQRLNGG